MSQTTMIVGPRGWAALTLAGGSVLALPFLRPTQSPDVSTVQPSISVNGDAGHVDEGIASFHVVATDSDMSGRRVVGNLPSTRQLAPASDAESFAVPDWARPESRLDELITSEATSLPTPKMENSLGATALRPWTPNEGVGSREEAQRDTLPRGAVLRGTVQRDTRAASQLSMRPVLPPAISQTRQSTQVDVAGGARELGFVVKTTSMTALPKYGTAEQSEQEPLPAPELRRRDRLANPPREKAFVYQPGMPRG